MQATLLLAPASEPQDKDRSKTLAWAAIIGVRNVALTIFAASVPFMVIPWLPRSKFGALPYMHTSARRVSAMVSMLGRHRSSLAGARFVDLGSGDGIVVVAAAHAGMRACGVELNPVLWAVSIARAELSGVGYAAAASSAVSRALGRPAGSTPPGSARFEIGNLLNTPVGGMDVVMVFGVAPLMPSVSAKLASELAEGSLVVMNRFRLPGGDGWVMEDEADNMALYRVTGEVKRRLSERA